MSERRYKERGWEGERPARDGIVWEPDRSRRKERKYGQLDRRRTIGFA